MQIQVDDQIVRALFRTTILQLCSNVNKYIPRFCYHQKLSVAANCRMCLVQLEDSLKPIASCAVAITNNLKISLNSIMVKKARESVLEFLLINHPLDCPICDQGGECDLQDQTILFGSDRGRFFENKRAVKELNLGLVVKTFMSRCIHCTRCIRFSRELLGSKELGLIGRGNNAHISTFINKMLTSELSGNVADICPVGALTLKPYAFMARPWELKNFVSLDVFDSFGTNIRIDVRGTEIMRILPYSSNDQNNEWITDKVRLFFDGLQKQRLTTPLIIASFQNRTNFVKNLSWSQSQFLITRCLTLWSTYLIGKKKLIFRFNGSCFSNIIHVGSTMELDLFIFLRGLFLNYGFATTSFSLCTKYSLTQMVFRSNYTFTSNYAKFKGYTKVILAGLNPRVEAPLFGIKLNTVSGMIFMFSPKIMTTFDNLSAGLGLRSFTKFLSGKHALCQEFGEISSETVAGNVSLVIGPGIISRFDSSNFYRYVDSPINLSRFLPNINYIIPYVAEINGLESGAFA